MGFKISQFGGEREGRIIITEEKRSFLMPWKKTSISYEIDLEPKLKKLYEGYIKCMEDEIDVYEYRDKYVRPFIESIKRITKDIKIREKIFNLALELAEKIGGDEFRDEVKSFKSELYS